MIRNCFESRFLRKTWVYSAKRMTAIVADSTYWVEALIGSMCWKAIVWSLQLKTLEKKNYVIAEYMTYLGLLVNELSSVGFTVEASIYGSVHCCKANWLMPYARCSMIFSMLEVVIHVLKPWWWLPTVEDWLSCTTHFHFYLVNVWF